MRIDPTALLRIEKAVKDVERSTSGEIVVVIAPRSDDWSRVKSAFALVIGTLGGILLSRLSELHAGWMALILPAIFALAWLFAGIGPLTRLLAGAKALDEATARAAKVAFLDHGVHQTRMRAGVLVYLSLLERRVQVLGDAAVHARVGAAGWAAVADRISNAMKTGKVDTLVDVVHDVGTTLMRLFPQGANDRNELSDVVRRT